MRDYCVESVCSVPTCRVLSYLIPEDGEGEVQGWMEGMAFSCGFSSTRCCSLKLHICGGTLMKWHGTTRLGMNSTLVSFHIIYVMKLRNEEEAMNEWNEVKYNSKRHLFSTFKNDLFV